MVNFNLKQIFPDKKRIFIYIAIILFLIAVIFILVLGIRINLIINDELNIQLTPLDKNFVTTYDQKKNITFEFENDNSMFCKSECSYQFTDLRNSTFIDEGSLILKHKTKVTKFYELSPNTYGSGQAIYSFDVNCHNIASFICRTDQEEHFKSSFITLSYDLNEQEKVKAMHINDALNYFLKKLRQSDIENKKINSIYDDSYRIIENTIFNRQLLQVSRDIKDTNIIINRLINDSNQFVRLWNSNQYPQILQVLPEKNKTLSTLSINLMQESADLNSIINDYNVTIQEIANLISKGAVIDSLISYYKSSNSQLEIDSINFKSNLSSLITSFYDKGEDKNSVDKRIKLLSSDIDYIITNANATHLIRTDLERELNFTLILIKPIRNATFLSNVQEEVKIKEPVCCVFGKCNPCCTTTSCRNNPRLYPILFLHGHSFSKDSSPETSLNSFAKIQRKLQEDGIINAGQIDLLNIESIPSGEYGRSGNPISVRASYYYIHYYDLGSYKLTTQKSERIENYALRLNDIINILKSRTGSDKVIIIAHSMGGLVGREYLRIFGEGSVDKIILVATPNQGISGSVKDLCDFLGSSKECEDMYAGSVFLKRLNQAKFSSQTKFYTISATGCDTDGQIGDGIVTQKSVQLAYSKNFNITGTCTNLFKNNLHQDMLDIDKYPQTYSLINNILKE